MGLCLIPKGVFAGALACLLSLHASLASATLFNVDFTSGGSPTQSGAGLIGSAGDTWNGVSGSPSASNIPLVDSTNAATNVKLAFVSTGAFDDTNNSFSATPFANLMRDYMYAGTGTTGTIGLSGLSANIPYNLILYSNPNQDRVRATEFIVNGVSKIANSVGTATEFIEGVNYVEFTGLFADGSGNLVIQYKFASGAGILEGDVNGFQIQSGPPPTPSGLVNIDFNSAGSPTQTGAGIFGAAGDFWNGVNGSPSAGNIALVDSAHAATNVKLAFVSTGAFDDTNNSFSATPFANLMRDYMYAGTGTTGTISLSGLSANIPHDLILYSNPNQDRVRATEFIVNGVSKIANSVGTATEFIEGVNYVEFTGLFTDGSGNLVIQYKFASGAGILEGDVNGLQIRAVVADLAITKTDGVTTATAGGSVTYTITASNAGPNDALGATVADTFDASLTCTWTCTGVGVGATCAAAGSGNLNDTVNLPVGGSVTYTASCNVAAAATGTLSNTATVEAPAGVTDPDSSNNSANDTDTLVASADLAIIKSDGATTATAGGSVTYTITASNAGPSNAIGAAVADTFPAALTCTWTCTGAGGGTCTAAGSGNVNDTVNLPAGGSITYTASCNVAPAATGTLSNTATVAVPAGVTDPDPSNNSANDTDTLVASADLAIIKSDGVTTATPGGSVTYTITASNAGPSNTIGAAVADTFPAALTCTWTCTGAGGGTCTAAGSGNVNDTVNLPAGGSITYTASCNVAAAATGTLSNTATVAAPAGVTDPDPSNNSANDTDTLVASADLAITKTDGVTTVTAGNSVTYTITASNAGPSNAPGTSVADTLPASLLSVTWTCGGVGGGTCTGAGSGNISDTVNLPAGSSITYTVNAILDPTATGTLSNTATVTAGAGVTDPNSANNAATDTDTITALTYVVTGVASPLAGGSVNCASPVGHGGTTTCTAVANATYTLTAISGCGGVASSTSPYTTGAVTAACTVTATFVLDIAVTGLAGQGGAIACASPVVPGSTTTCTVTPEPGRDIASISGCGGVPGTSNPYTTGPITTPCAVTVTFVALPIPALGGVGLVLLMLMLAGAGVVAMRRNAR